MNTHTDPKARWTERAFELLRVGACRIVAFLAGALILSQLGTGFWARVLAVTVAAVFCLFPDGLPFWLAVRLLPRKETV